MIAGYMSKGCICHIHSAVMTGYVVSLSMANSNEASSRSTKNKPLKLIIAHETFYNSYNAPVMSILMSPPSQLMPKTSSYVYRSSQPANRVASGEAN